MDLRNEPIYRPVIREAILFSWKQKRLWVIALIAGILTTGSVFDVVWKSINSLTMQASVVGLFFPFWQKAVGTWSHFSITELIVGSLQVLVVTGFVLLLVFVVFALSIIAQGTIIHAIGASRRGKPILFSESMRVGARSIWPIFVLNLISLAMLLACRSLIAIALAFSLQTTSGFVFFVYMISFILFTLLSIATFIVQIFAMNAMILQGATLSQAITRGIDILKRHWMIVAEVTSILFLISVGIFAVAITGGLLLSIPFFICLIVSAATGSYPLFIFVTVLFILIYTAFLIFSGGFSVLLHYSVWTSMFRAFGEGGVLPKINRIARAFIHQTDIPGAK